MIKLVHGYLPFKRLVSIVFVLLFISCSNRKESQHGPGLLSIPVKSSESVDLDHFNQQLIELTQRTENKKNLFLILSQLWFEPYAQASVISINKMREAPSNAYGATLIFSDIPDDDSVRGYRYDITVKENLQGQWEMTEVKTSWCCWPDRGHDYFSIEPCF